MRILIIEDEKSIAEALYETIRKNDILVDVCYDGEEGVSYALTGIYDLLIIDLMLPKRNGIDVIKEIRNNSINSKIIILSAKDEEDIKVIGLSVGADDYVTKPFSTKELMARIKASLRRQGEKIQNILNFYNLKYNLGTNELFYENKSVKLKNKEAHLMSELMFANGNIVSKDKMFDKIWGFEFEGDYNVIETYLSFLRRKLKFLECDVQIKASRGIGYYLEKEND